jgi:3'(2'), 5'-bisphosphate nucleotidase
VLTPAKNLLYFADKETGAYKIDENGLKTKIKSKFSGGKPMVIASRSHRDERIGKLLDALGEHEEISMGSSLKLCLIAEGKAQIYPRLAPTYLWDTAAAHAIVNIAGGRVRQLNDDELKYEPQKEMKNPFFVATTANDTIFEGNRDILRDI